MIAEKALQWLEPLKELMKHIVLVASVCFSAVIIILLIPADWTFLKELIDLRNAKRGLLLLALLISGLTLLFKCFQVILPMIGRKITLFFKVQYIKDLEPSGKRLLKRYFTEQDTMIDVGRSNLLIDEMSRKGVIHFVSPMIITNTYNPSHYTIDKDVCDYLKHNLHLLDTEVQKNQNNAAVFKKWLKQWGMPL